MAAPKAWPKCSNIPSVYAFRKVYSRPASVGDAADGFSKTDIYTLSKVVFADYEFIATNEEPSENVEPQFETSLSQLVSFLYQERIKNKLIVVFNSVLNLL